MSDEIKEALKAFDDNIELAFIYGSIAKGADSKSSDIDLMLVGEGLHYGDIMEALIPVEESLQRTVNPSIYTKSDLEKKIKERNNFILRVLEQPTILIKGVINDVRKPCKDTPAK